METSLILNALEMAFISRKPSPGLIFHSTSTSSATMIEVVNMLVMNLKQLLQQRVSFKVCQGKVMVTEPVVIFRQAQ